MSERVESWWRGFEWCILNAKKFGVVINLKKWSVGLCNRWVFIRNPDTSKEIVQFVHEVRPVFAVTQEVRSCNKLLKFWIAGVTDEFSSETLILRKRLSSLHTKCIQFFRWPSLLFCTCYAGEMMIPCQVSTFSRIHFVVIFDFTVI